MTSTQTDFNSIVVRLKATSIALVGMPQKFQFHCGAIKSLKDFAALVFVLRISIPLWCD